jgi:hypothetical protein
MALLRPRSPAQATTPQATPPAQLVGATPPAAPRYNPSSPPPLQWPPANPKLAQAYPHVRRYELIGQQDRPPPVLYAQTQGPWVRWIDVEPLLERLAQLEGKAP